jgi:hypothetical protein
MIGLKGETGIFTSVWTDSRPDGSSISEAYNTFDWCNNALHPEAVLPPAAGFTGTARNCPGDLSLRQNQTRFVYNTDCSDFNIYETIIPTDDTKNIVSFTFTNARWFLV